MRLVVSTVAIFVVPISTTPSAQKFFLSLSSPAPTEQTDTGQENTRETLHINNYNLHESSMGHCFDKLQPANFSDTDMKKL